MIKFEVQTGTSALVVAAIHNGHEIRPEILPYLNLTDQQREREEDPFTADLTNISDNYIKIQTSRFETDINRPRDKAVYQNPKDAWGLELYGKPLPEEIIQESLANYDQFYDCMDESLRQLLDIHPKLIVYDLHSYNHRREGIDQYADPHKNPEINIGTGNVDKSLWTPVIECLIECVKSYNYMGRSLEVGENVKFSGGYFTKWLNENYGDRICPVAIEIKKFFMNEWTGEVDRDQLDHLRQMLINTIHPVIETMESL